MFTGLVEKIGTVKRVSRGRGLVIEFAFEPWREPLVPGESVAVNGTCLTVARCDSTRFTADVLRETERRTGLAELKPGDKVNLERAMKANARLGGHIVQGHVDGRGVLVSKTPKGRDFALTFRCGRVLACGCVEKGSIAVNGVSLPERRRYDIHPEPIIAQSTDCKGHAINRNGALLDTSACQYASATECKREITSLRSL